MAIHDCKYVNQWIDMNPHKKVTEALLIELGLDSVYELYNMDPKEMARQLSVVRLERHCGLGARSMAKFVANFKLIFGIQIKISIEGDEELIDDKILLIKKQRAIISDMLNSLDLEIRQEQRRKNLII